MGMITRIEATNYRCLEKADVDLSQFAVLVGANGAGKTTLFDIPDMLAECLQQPSVGQAFTMSHDGYPPRCSSLEDLIFQGAGNYFSIALEAKLPEAIIEQLDAVYGRESSQKKLAYMRYEVRFEIVNNRLLVGTENLFLFPRDEMPERGVGRICGDYNMPKSWRSILSRGSNNISGLRVETNKNAKTRNLDVSNTLLALPKVKFEPVGDFPAASWFHDLLCEKSVFYQPNLHRLQTASPPGLPEGVMSDAANLPWLALKLQRNEARFKLWVEHVKTALPQVDNITVKEREEDHHAYFVVYYRGGYKVTTSGLSEGTLRILALTILPYLDDLPSLIITEEPETGIHPRAIETVLQSLSSVYDSQVLISSHSPVVLAQCDLTQVLCARLADNGGASIIKGDDHPQLKDWKGQVDLGALFAAGVLG